MKALLFIWSDALFRDKSMELCGMPSCFIQSPRKSRTKDITILVKAGEAKATKKEAQSNCGLSSAEQSC